MVYTTNCCAFQVNGPMKKVNWFNYFIQRLIDFCMQLLLFLLDNDLWSTVMNVPYTYLDGFLFILVWR